MIGNDIVDLKLAAVQSNWQRKGFLNKVFTKKEQSLILNAINKDEMVWLLWSMKESAYKIHVQQYSQRFFDPKKLVCSLINQTNGLVVINNNKYKTESTITNQSIFTTATLLTSTNKVTDYPFVIKESSTKNQSKLGYHQLKKTITEKTSIPYQELYIQKTAVGVPKIYRNKTAINIPFSITHHGNFGAVSILN